jgi:hypothetical protein
LCKQPCHSESPPFVIPSRYCLSFRAKRGILVSSVVPRTLSVYQCPKISPSASSIPLPIFLRPRPHNLLHQRIRQRLIRREVDRPFRNPVSLQFLLELVEHSRPRREQAAMLLERRVSHQHPIELKHRHAIADHLGRLCWNDRSNHLTQMPQRTLRRLGSIREILIDRLWGRFSSHLNSMWGQPPSAAHRAKLGWLLRHLPPLPLAHPLRLRLPRLLRRRPL